MEYCCILYMNKFLYNWNICSLTNCFWIWNGGYYEQKLKSFNIAIHQHYGSLFCLWMMKHSLQINWKRLQHMYTWRKIYMGKVHHIFRVIPYGVIPFWEDPLFDPYCNPMTFFPSASCFFTKFSFIFVSHFHSNDWSIITIFLSLQREHFTETNWDFSKLCRWIWVISVK